MQTFTVTTPVNASPISDKWLSEQVTTLSTQKSIQFAVYIKPLSQQGTDIVLNYQKIPLSSLIKIPIMIEAFRQKNRDFWISMRRFSFDIFKQ